MNACGREPARASPLYVRRSLLAIFVVSGFAGLIYESVWSHYLKLFLGHAAYAQSLVLAIYMGGMALGSWAVARRAYRFARPLRAYVVVEALIGLMGLAFHASFVAASDYSFATVIPALSSAGWIRVYKWTLAAVLVLPQSIMLGMTFPLISASLIRRWPERPGETLATLYFTNSLGAAIGVLTSGFVLINAVGLPGTIRIAGLLNIALAIVIWAMMRGRSEPAVSALAPAPFIRSDSWARWFIFAAFLSGAASFLYELGWIRMLSLVLGSSTHSFELMLSAFILGLAFGGLYVRTRVERIREPVAYVAGLMVITGALAALTLPAYDLTFDFMAWFLRTFARTVGGYVGFNLISQLIAALIMIPASFCAGMTLPLLTRELMRRGAGERAIGLVYSANTLGAIVGVLLTTHVLMPVFGIKGVILGGAGIHIALGLSRLLVGRTYPTLSVRLAMAGGIGTFVVVLFAVHLDPLRMTSGVYRTGSATLPEGASVAYLRDGETATISLIEKEGLVTIGTNGKPDAAVQMGSGEISVDESTMVLAAAIPLSMLPHPRRVANIGFGSGLTAHALLGSSLVGRLDSIEIEPFMVEAARAGFGSRIGNVFEDPRSHVIYDDAKTFFATAREPYDLIVSEPSNPWVSGVATLFSDEFYARITHYLTADGYFAQWVQVYETNLGVLASIIKALSPHFGAYTLYNVDDLDLLIVATRADALRTPDESLLDFPGLRAELQRVGIQSTADFQSRKIGDNHTLDPLFAAVPGPANSDFYPFVDLHAPRSRFLRENVMELPALTLLSIPFLELLDPSGARGDTREPSANSAVIRDRYVMRALDIRRALISGRSDTLDSASAHYLWLGTRTDACATAPDQAAWRDAVRNLSDDTAAYLNSAELEPIWKSILSSPCYREGTGDGNTWVDLFAAIARRDASGIVRVGTRLLARPSHRSDGDIAYLTTVTAAAYVRLGEKAQARTLVLAQWPRFNHTGPFDLALRDLRALTR